MGSVCRRHLDFVAESVNVGRGFDVVFAGIAAGRKVPTPHAHIDRIAAFATICRRQHLNKTLGGENGEQY